MTASVHAILVGLLSVAHTPEQAEHAARNVLQQHAHALAEKQRAFADQEDGHLRTTSAAVYVQGIRDAADRIDPTPPADPDGAAT